jgi:hypothetical protein
MSTICHLPYHGSMATKGSGKVGKVMREYRAGTLKSGSGVKVTGRKQAVAIALSEARKGKK